MSVYVKCKTEGCDAEVPAPMEVQNAGDDYKSHLHKKNYYLCQKCGQVGMYTPDDHVAA